MSPSSYELPADFHGDVFHGGELRVQEQCGTRPTAERLRGAFHEEMPSAAADFLAAQRMVLLGGSAPRGEVWANAVTGTPGFLHALDPTRLWIQALPSAEDPLADCLASGAAVGLLAIDFEARRRLRLNGFVESRPESGLVIRAQQVYSNCSKYIHRRRADTAGLAEADRATRSRSGSLDVDAAARIAAADTLFIATAHRVGGADVSHRGGAPGFVQVEDAATLSWPDFSGNGLFQTHGNLSEDPRAGLLVIDFRDGTALQMTGTAQVVDERRSAQSPPGQTAEGTQRRVQFRIEQWVARSGAVPIRWIDLET